VPTRFEELLGHTAIHDTVTDDELAHLRQEITRDVTTTLMFGLQRPSREARRATKTERADVYLQTLACRLLGNHGASDHLAQLADDPSDVKGALYFGCLLSLAREAEGALWWWQFAAGAGSVDAAYCLYLLHLSHGDLRDAEHWMRQILASGSRVDFIPPPLWLRRPRTPHAAALKAAVKGLHIEEVAGAPFHHPDHRLADAIEGLDGVC
jgi:hypothetical protein